MVKLTPTQRKNLATLARYLMDFKRPPPKFDMFKFHAHMSDLGHRLEPTPFEAQEPECGAVACAVGHAPHAGIKPRKTEDWIEYCLRVFGCRLNHKNSELFLWLFDCDWTNTDNTPKGAAKRIIYFLKHGIPDTADNQRFGTHPRCLRDRDWETAPSFYG